MNLSILCTGDVSTTPSTMDDCVVRQKKMFNGARGSCKYYSYTSALLPFLGFKEAADSKINGIQVNIIIAS